MRRGPILLLLAVGLLAGCAALEPPGPRELAGPTDGYTPTSSFLKLHIKREDGTTALLDFDRKDWYTAEIARRADRHDLDFVTAQAQPREILGEYIALSVIVPEELQKLRYEEMGATHEERALMDAEHDELLKALPGGTPTPPDVLPGEVGLP